MKKLICRLCGVALLTVSPLGLAFYTQQGDIYADDSELVIINGVSWSGFQDTNVLQGLQSNAFYGFMAKGRYGLMDLLIHSQAYPSGSVSAPFFKTVRIPIQPGILNDNSNEVDLNKGLTDKHYPTAGNGIFCKKWQANSDNCEVSVSSQEAFWTTIEEMQTHGLRVLVDIHHRYGYGDGIRDGTVYNMAQYQQDLKVLSEQISQKGLTNIIGIDIFNEPYRLNWFHSANGQVPWTKVIAMAANVVCTSNPSLLLFVEGPGGGNDDQDEPVICVPRDQIITDPDGYSHSPDPAVCGALDRVYFKGNWGEDFKPLLHPVKARQNIHAFDRARFETELLKQGISQQALDWLLGDEYGNHAHIVFSPHVYPKEVAGWETAPGAPSNLRFDWSWGFLSQAGYSVVLGEASWKTESGKSFFTDALMPYLAQRISAHHVFFWGIGFLGDTVTVINPHNGERNIDVYDTLSSYFD